MAVKDIYFKAIDSVQNGEMSKEEFWELIHEHLAMKESENERLVKDLKTLTEKYQNLTSKISEVHKEHEQYCKLSNSINNA